MKKLQILFLCVVATILLTACGSDEGVTFENAMEAINKAETESKNTIEEYGEQAEEDAKDSVSQVDEYTYSKYDKLMDDYESGRLEDKSGMNTKEHLMYWMYIFIFSFKKYAPYIVAFSEVFGLLFFVFGKGNRGLQKFGIFGLCIMCPIIVILIVYGQTIFNSFL